MKHVLIRMFNAFALTFLLVELVGYAIFENPLFKRTPIPGPVPPEIVLEDNPIPRSEPVVGSAGVDSDNDGMPDSWELANFLRPYYAADARSDFDGDGITARQECSIGTNPNGTWTIQTVPLNDLLPAMDQSATAPIQLVDVNNSGSVVFRIPIVNPQTFEVIKTSWYFSSSTGMVQIAPEATDYDVEVFDLNDEGVSVGRMISRLDGTVKGFIWQNGSVSDLITPDGAPAVAKRINNRGNWVGFQWEPMGAWGPNWYPVAVIDGQLWKNEYDSVAGTSTSALFGGLPVADILGINENDQVLAVYIDYWNWSMSLAVAWKGYIESAGLPLPSLTSPSPWEYNEARINNNGEFAAPNLFFDGAVHSFSGYQISGLTDDGMVLESTTGMGASVMAWSDGVEIPIGAALLNNATVGSASVSSNCTLAVTDGSFPEIRILTKNQDQDGDGMSDDWETLYGYNPNNASDAVMDPDGDGINNLGEFLLKSDPQNPPVYDSQGNAIDIRPGIDSDGDGIPNIWEWKNGLNYLDASDAAKDFDRDGFSNLREYSLNTNPLGAPVYRIREIGPFSDGVTLSANQQVLSMGRPVETCLLPNEGNITESVFVAANPPNSGGTVRPAVWIQPPGNLPGSLTVCPEPNPLPGNPILSAPNGAAFQQTPGQTSQFLYWASPISKPITLSGAELENDISNLDETTVRFSPSGRFLIGTRSPAGDPNTFEPVIWRMPESVTQKFKPVVLTPPQGVSLDSGNPIFVNDFGWVVSTGILEGRFVPVIWVYDPQSNSLTSDVLPEITQGLGARVAGISNHESPIIGGTAPTYDGLRAVVWDTQGGMTDMELLPAGTDSEILAVSPAGYMAGRANTLINNAIITVPTVIPPASQSSSLAMIPGRRSMFPQGDTQLEFTITSISDAGEIIGSVPGNGPGGSLVPTIWKNGRVFSLEHLLPPESGFVFESLLGMNSNGSILVRAYKHGLNLVLLTPDPDTDGDGLPDAYENKYGLNAFIPSDPNADLDLDGLTDMKEFLHGTNPSNIDSDSDGMKDGWEVQWGLLPTDPSDSSLDPDQDGVANLREYQIGTNPSGIYELRGRDVIGNWQVQHVNDSGATIEYDNSTSVSGVGNDGRQFNSSIVRFVRHSRIGDEGLPVELIPSEYTLSFDPSWSDVSSHKIEPSYRLSSKSEKTTAFLIESNLSLVDGQWVGSTTASLTSDVVNHPDRSSWVNWSDVQETLRESSIISEDATLSIDAVMVSQGGERRVHPCNGEYIVLDADGDYIEKLPSGHPWTHIDDSGNAVGLEYNYGGNHSLHEFKNGVISTFEIPREIAKDLIIAELSQDGKVLCYSIEDNEHGFPAIRYILIDAKIKSINRIKLPAMSSEGVFALSRHSGLVIGSGGNNPWKVGPDGSTLMVKALQIVNQAGGPTVPVGQILSNLSSSALITSGGAISTGSIDAQGRHAVWQIVPAQDSDGDGLSDDQELDILKNLVDSGVVQNPSNGGPTDINLDLDYDRDGVSLRNELKSGRSDSNSGDAGYFESGKDTDNDGLADSEDADPWDPVIDWHRSKSPRFIVSPVIDRNSVIPPDEVNWSVDADNDGNLVFGSSSVSYDGEGVEILHPKARCLPSGSSSIVEVGEFETQIGSFPDCLSTFEDWYQIYLDFGMQPVRSKRVSQGGPNQKPFVNILNFPFIGSYVQYGNKTSGSGVGAYDPLSRMNPLNVNTLVTDNSWDCGNFLSMFGSDFGIYMGIDDKGKAQMSAGGVLPRTGDAPGSFALTAYFGANENSGARYYSPAISKDHDVVASVVWNNGLNGGMAYWEFQNGTYKDPIIYYNRFLHSGRNPMVDLDVAHDDSSTHDHAKLIAVSSLQNGVEKILSVDHQVANLTGWATVGDSSYPLGDCLGISKHGWLLFKSSAGPLLWVNGVWRPLGSYFAVDGWSLVDAFEMSENGVVCASVASVQAPNAPVKIAFLAPIEVESDTDSQAIKGGKPLAPSEFRKISTNGKPYSASKPQEAAEVDLPGEETTIDAYTRLLQHQTSQVFVPVPSSDLALQMQMSYDNTPIGIPSQNLRSDRAIVDPTSFAVGQRQTVGRELEALVKRDLGIMGVGWRTNLGAKITCTPQTDQISQPGLGKDRIRYRGYLVEVEDEGGSTFTFRSSDLKTFERVASPISSANDFLVSLKRVVSGAGSELVLSKKFGTSLKYAWTSEPDIDPERIANGEAFPSMFEAKLVSCSDRYGVIVNYGPTSVTAQGRGGLSLQYQVSQEAGAEGHEKFELLKSVTDPRGKITRFGYKWVSILGGLIPVLETVTKPDGAVTTYEASVKIGVPVTNVSKALDDAIRSPLSPHYNAIASAPAPVATRQFDRNDEWQTSASLHVNLTGITNPLGATTKFEYEADSQSTAVRMSYRVNASVVQGMPAFLTNAVETQLAGIESKELGELKASVESSFASKGATKVGEGLFAFPGSDKADVVCKVVLPNGKRVLVEREAEAVVPADPSSFYRSVPDFPVQRNGGSSGLSNAKVRTVVTDALDSKTKYDFSGYLGLFWPNQKVAGPSWEPFSEDDPRTTQIEGDVIPEAISYTTILVEREGDKTLYEFEPSAGLAIKSVKERYDASNPSSSLTTVYGYGNTLSGRFVVSSGLEPNDPLAALVPVAFNDPTSEVKSAPGETPISKSFDYDGESRVMKSSVDASGNETWYEVGTMGRRMRESRYQGSKSANVEVARTDFLYENPAFPAFVTKEIVRKLDTQSSSDPAWVVDLVTEYQPDSMGRIFRKIVDPNGLNLVTETTYDAAGNKQTEKDPKLRTTAFQYDLVGRLVEVIYPDGTSKSFGYNLNGQKVRETDENGHSTFMTYDALGRPASSRREMDGPDLISYTVYDTAGGVVKATDPMGGITTTEYDSLHRPILVTDALGGQTRFDYSGPNSGTTSLIGSGYSPTRSCDARGFITETTYDGFHRPKRVKKEIKLGGSSAAWKTRNLGPSLVTETTYTPTGKPKITTSYRDGGSGASVNSHTFYDALDRAYLTKTAEGDALESVSRTLFTSTGLPWKSIAFEGNADLERHQATEYDAVGRAVKVFGPDPVTGLISAKSAVTETRHDDNSNVSYTIDPRGSRTDFKYDSRNRRTEVLSESETDWSVTGNPLVRSKTTTTYDLVGNVKTVRDHYGMITESLYDWANRSVLVTVARGLAEQAVTETAYDANGNVISVKDPNGNFTRNFYDALNRQVASSVNPTTGNPSENLSAPGSGDLIVANAYDATGNLTKVADGEAVKIWEGDSWRFSNGAGHVTEFSYDGLNRKTSTVWDSGSAVAKTEESIYDSLYQTARVDAKLQRTEYAYDSLGRVSGVTYVGRTTDNRVNRYAGGTSGASGPGALEAVTYPNGGDTRRDVTYTLDRLDRATAETSADVTHQYQYDAAGNRVLVTYGGTYRKLVSIFDKLSRLKQVIDTTGSVSNPLTYVATGGDRATTYRYDALGRSVKVEMPNGTATLKTYDKRSRVKLLQTVASAMVISSFNYTGGYDKVSNVLSFSESSSNLPARTVVNVYDRTYRLTSESVTTGGVLTRTSYLYDKACNRTSKTVQNPSGSTTQTFVFGQPSIGYNTNQLRGIGLPGVSAPTQASQFEITYTYDQNGNRSTRSKAGLTDVYGYDYDNRLVTLDKATAGGTGSYVYQYDYRTRRVLRDEPGTSDASITFSGGTSVQEYSLAPEAGSQPTVETLRGSDMGGGVGGVLYTLRNGFAAYDAYNSRGDVVAQTNDGGGVEWQRQYEAFGTQTAQFGTNSDRQRANSKDEDPTGLLNEGMRYRDLDSGVFITRDPAGFVDGPNVYAYVRQNPWTSFDPLGLSECNFYQPDQNGDGINCFKADDEQNYKPEKRLIDGVENVYVIHYPVNSTVHFWTSYKGDPDRGGWEPAEKYGFESIGSKSSRERFEANIDVRANLDALGEAANKPIVNATFATARCTVEASLFILNPEAVMLRELMLVREAGWAVKATQFERELAAANSGARFGTAGSKNYRATFFEANAGLEGKVVVHHAVEQQVLTRFPRTVTEAEIHSLENLRGIPKPINSDLHLSQIRKSWNEFYRSNPTPSQQQLLEHATKIDDQFGHLFNPPVR